jgi:type VI secretion system protein ImpM
MSAERPGVFGKLPAHGDFVRRGLPRAFLTPGDAWLSAGVEAARAHLGEGWGPAWEAAPAWRFRLAPGTCGPQAVAGVLLPSRDQVGRRFPLTLAAVGPAAAVLPAAEWYAALEAAAAAARAGELDADRLEASLPPLPCDDPDATLDRRSLFWREGAPARPMPAAAEFPLLLGEPA